MPYIKSGDREVLDPVAVSRPETVGDLNFAITRLADDFLRRQGVSYANINAVVGVLECAKLELYRRIAAPYEDVARLRNGEVYRTAPEDGK
jgi:hypothetical protein